MIILLNFFYFQENRMTKSLRIFSSFMTVDPGELTASLTHQRCQSSIKSIKRSRITDDPFSPARRYFRNKPSVSVVSAIRLTTENAYVCSRKWQHVS